MGDTRIKYDSCNDLKLLPKWVVEVHDLGGIPVSAFDFYNDIFGNDLEEARLPEDYVRGEYAGIAIEKVPSVKSGQRYFKGRRTIITKGNEELFNLIDRSENFCMVAPISYAGRSRKNTNARFLYALTIEIDDIQPKDGIRELFYLWERETLPRPKPTYVVCSGNGIHLYYLFERPIPLFKNIFEELAAAKKWLTPLFWDKPISKSFDKVQYESLNQPFRCVGSRAKDNTYVMAFKVGERITIEYLNKYLPQGLKLEAIYKSKMSLEEAKERYPDWYQRRIVKGEKPGHIKKHEGIYFNWIEKIKKDGRVGHRYNCLENLCSLAVQCGIAPEQVEADCRMMAKHFEELTISEDNHFGEYDVLCALRTYHNASDTAYRRRIEYISKKTNIVLVPNKRNHRPQAVHIKRITKLRDLDYEDGSWRNKDGAPKKEKLIKQWRAEHPDGTKIQCQRETGISRPTIIKWW